MNPFEPDNGHPPSNKGYSLGAEVKYFGSYTTVIIPLDELKLDRAMYTGLLWYRTCEAMFPRSEYHDISITKVGPIIHVGVVVTLAQLLSGEWTDMVKHLRRVNYYDRDKHLDSLLKEHADFGVFLVSGAFIIPKKGHGVEPVEAPHPPKITISHYGGEEIEVKNE